MSSAISARRTRAAAALGAAAAALAFPAPASAHALVGRQDLPIPEWLFAWGASVVLIISFVALSLAWHRSRFSDDGWRPVRPWLSRLVVNPVTEVLAGLAGVFLLVVVVWSGLQGTEAPDRNFSVTFVFVTKSVPAHVWLKEPLAWSWKTRNEAEPPSSIALRMFRSASAMLL